jgi:hypothetical protein
LNVKWGKKNVATIEASSHVVGWKEVRWEHLWWRLNERYFALPKEKNDKMVISWRDILFLVWIGACVNVPCRLMVSSYLWFAFKLLMWRRWKRCYFVLCPWSFLAMASSAGVFLMIDFEDVWWMENYKKRSC